LTGAFLGDEHPDAGYAGYVDQAGARPQLLLTFVAWRREGEFPFPEAFCRFAREHRAVPIITWEPWEPWSEWFPLLEEIAAGKYDRQVRRWATVSRQQRHTILLRFGHEMNGDWYPWSERKDARQSAGRYVQAWRRIRRRFTEAGASNVQFIWCPNFEPAEAIARFYPGDDVVDWIGIDVYNQPDWPRPAAEMIEPVYAFAVQRDKPVILAEVGCAEASEGAVESFPDVASHSKARWIDGLFRTLEARPAVRGMVWFNVSKEADWRIGSSSSAAAAYRGGIAHHLSR
jgi:hypothetical protein